MLPHLLICAREHHWRTRATHARHSRPFSSERRVSGVCRALLTGGPENTMRGLKEGSLTAVLCWTCCGKRDTVTFCPTDYPPRGNQRHFQLPANTGRVHGVLFPCWPLLLPVRGWTACCQRGVVVLLDLVPFCNQEVIARTNVVKSSYIYLFAPAQHLSRKYWP